MTGDPSALGRRVRRLTRRTLASVLPGVKQGDPRGGNSAERSLRRQADRIVEALAVVQRIEVRQSSLPKAGGSRDFLTLDRVARRPEIAQHLHTMLPAALRGDWDLKLPAVQHVAAPVAADVVVLAKFDLHERVKLRAAYEADRQTVAVQPDTPHGRSGIAAAVRSHEIGSRYAPGLMPVMTGHGELGAGQRYLVEEWIDGVPLTTGGIAKHVVQIVEGLHRIHQGYGVHTRRPSDLWPRLVDQWRAVRQAGLVPDAVAAKLLALLTEDRRLRVSWSHGDLVPSNVMASGDTLTIIDWEHAAELPMMHDAAKLQLFSARKEPLLDLLVAEWGERRGADGYGPAEELALTHARFLCGAPARMVKLAGHPREGIYATQVARQVDLLTHTLECVS